MGSVATQDGAAAERLGPLKIAAHLRAAIVDAAQARDRIEGDAGAVTVLVHAPHARVLDHELLGDIIHQWRQLHEEMTALAAAGTGRKIVGDGKHRWLCNHTQLQAGGDTWLQPSQVPE